jgi:hypothetical protein
VNKTCERKATIMKFIKEFSGVKDGEIYPVDFKPGEECPKELEASALALGALPSKKETPAEKKAREDEEAKAADSKRLEAEAAAKAEADRLAQEQQ